MFLRHAFSAVALVASISAATGQQVPTLQGTTLAGDRVDFPDVLRGHSSVLIVSFSQSARDNVTAWYKRFNTDYKGSSSVFYYEMPVLAGAPGFLRGTIIKKIKGDVPAAAQPHFVPVLDHEDQWKASSGWSKQASEDHAYILLVDGTGTIRFHGDFPVPTDQSYTELKKRLESLRP